VAYVSLRAGSGVVAALVFAAAFVGVEPTSAAAKPDRAVVKTAAVVNRPAIKGIATTNDALSFDAWDRIVVKAIDARVLTMALNAAQCAIGSGAVGQPATLTIIDYSKPSTEPRLWVLDLRTRQIVYEELVAHGQGSGGNLADKFSNEPDSHQTSLGLFVTEGTYVGRNGYSLRLNGLERGFNDRAKERAIVMHGAPYVNDAIGKSLGRLGRSHGCPAVREPIARQLIDHVKGGSLVFSYYPDTDWLATSTFLNACQQARQAD
jgi:L,D-transpeptidase catalytic domain